MTLPEDISILPESTETRLNPRQLQDYTEHGALKRGTVLTSLLNNPVS